MSLWAWRYREMCNEWSFMPIHSMHSMKTAASTSSLLLDSFSLYYLLVFSHISSSATQMYLFFAYSLPAVKFPFVFPYWIAPSPLISWGFLFIFWLCPWKVSILEPSKNKWLQWLGRSEWLSWPAAHLSRRLFFGTISSLNKYCSKMRESLVLKDSIVEVRSFLTSVLHYGGKHS